ncbi:MAG TPA: hypothetical protein VIM73_22900 [Polyangiaceae bacterium]
MRDAVSAGSIWFAVLFGVSVLGGCESGCDPELIDRADAFVSAHQSCEIDDDCLVVNDYCGELSGGFCGQLTMNRAGVESEEWGRMKRELGDCAPDECAVCAALLIPTCTNGLCRRL